MLSSCHRTTISNCRVCTVWLSAFLPTDTTQAWRIRWSGRMASRPWLPASWYPWSALLNARRPGIVCLADLSWNAIPRRDEGVELHKCCWITVNEMFLILHQSFPPAWLSYPLSNTLSDHAFFTFTWFSECQENIAKFIFFFLDICTAWFKAQVWLKLLCLLHFLIFLPSGSISLKSDSYALFPWVAGA